MEIDSPALKMYKDLVNKGMERKEAAVESQRKTGLSLRTGFPMQVGPKLKNKKITTQGVTLYG